MVAVVDYLKHLNIRFHDGGGSGSGQRKFRLKIRDPFHSDVAPEWLIEAKAQSDNLERAIYEFVERHEKRRLHKHASRGNVNGMENFLDIFTTLVRLLYVYFKRGVVKKGRLIGRFCKFLELATIGKNTEKEAFHGYLYSAYDSLGGDVDLLQEYCDETNYLSEIRVALLIVQDIRYDPNENASYGPKPTRPRDVLRVYARAVDEAIYECDLHEPQADAVRRALESYRMLTEGDISRLLKELPDT